MAASLAAFALALESSSTPRHNFTCGQRSGIVAFQAGQNATKIYSDNLESSECNLDDSC